MHVYEYTDEIPRDFPALGLRNLKKGDKVESAEALNNPFLKEVTDNTNIAENNDYAEGSVIE
jgi:hypothetical protein